MQRIVQLIRQRYEEIVQDSDARFELRQGLFLLVIVCGLLFLAHMVWVAQKQGVNDGLRRQYEQLRGASAGAEVEQLLAAELVKLAAEKKTLQERITFLNFQQRLLHEQYPAGKSDQSFANVIFTLLPLSPVDIENGFVQMSVLDNRTGDFYDISPVQLQGDIDYAQFLHYLHYLEDRPEVGMIGDISLEHSAQEGDGERGKIHFDVVLGRIELHPANASRQDGRGTP